MNDGLRDSAFRAGFWQFVEQRAKQLKDAAKAELQSLEAGDAVTGKWHGQPVAKATMTAGRSKIVVTDPCALLEWVRRFRIQEVVESVNPAYVSSLKSADGIVIDNIGDSPPGVEVQQGSSYVSIRKADGAEAVIAELFRSGAVGLDGITPAALPPVVDAAHLDSMPSNRWIEPEVKPEVEPEPADRFTQDMEAGAIG